MWTRRTRALLGNTAAVCGSCQEELNRWGKTTGSQEQAQLGSSREGGTQVHGSRHSEDKGPELASVPRLHRPQETQRASTTQNWLFKRNFSAAVKQSGPESSLISRYRKDRVSPVPSRTCQRAPKPQVCGTSQALSPPRGAIGSLADTAPLAAFGALDTSSIVHYLRSFARATASSGPLSPDNWTAASPLPSGAQIVPEHRRLRTKHNLKSQRFPQLGAPRLPRTLPGWRWYPPKVPSSFLCPSPREGGRVPVCLRLCARNYF